MGISVVIPYYNRSRFIEECLASVFSQTLQPDEVIVVDDCSRPEESEFLARIPGIKVVRHGVNQGAGAARDTGFREASHEWIAYHDSDDIWHPDKLRLQWEYLQAHPEADGVQARLQSVYSSGLICPWHAKPSPFTLSDSLVNNCIGAQTLLIRRDALEAVNGWARDMRISDDQDLGVRLALAGKQIHSLPEILVDVRRAGHEHLEGDWKLVIYGDMHIMQKYWDLYVRELGFWGTAHYAARLLRRAGERRGRLMGRLIWVSGWILGFFEAGID